MNPESHQTLIGFHEPRNAAFNARWCSGLSDMPQFFLLSYHTLQIVLSTYINIRIGTKIAYSKDDFAFGRVQDMRMFTASGILLLLMNQACQKDKLQDGHQDSQGAAEPAPVTASADGFNKTKSSAQTPKPPAPIPKPVSVTCDSLDIPSYEFWIKDLADLRCTRCHNETFAWNGIVLTQYQGFKTYAEKIEYRIANNLLTKPLDPIEQAIFLKWIDNKMPNLEADCAGMTKPSAVPK